MAQPATNPKIEELRSRLKTDPKNRIFYPLAEELRKVGQFTESEQVLRAGLAYHPTYLSAWVSLGRVLRDLKNDAGAIEALSKALQLDPGNVVAARLLGDAYLGLGEKVEAIKKYKLVQALLPGDEEMDGIVERLDREINPPAAATAAAEEESPFAPEPESAPFDNSAARRVAAETPFAPEPQVGEETATMRPRRDPAPPAEEESPFAPEPTPLRAPSFMPASPAFETEAASEDADSPFAPESPAGVPPPQAPSPSFFAEEAPSEAHEPPAPEPRPLPEWSSEPPAFTDAGAALQREFQSDMTTGDSEPMAAEHTESPFEEPAAYTAAAFEVESPAGMHEAVADVAAELPTVDLPAPESAVVTADSRFADESDVFAPAAEPVAETETQAPDAPQHDEGDLTNTLTMADLYARQGLVADARQIYENILQRDPGNEAVRMKLEALKPSTDAETTPAAADDRVTRLERWLSKVGKREVGRV